MKPPKERFYKKFIRIKTCWIWTDNLDKDGYGRFRVGKKQLRANRFSYEFHKGKIPEGMYVCHNCAPEKDNPSCVNPEHLFLGRNIDNMKDGVFKNQFVKGSKHSQAKLKETDIPIIRKMALELTHKEIAKKYSVARSTISRVIKKDYWRHI